MVTEGDQVVIGDTPARDAEGRSLTALAYEVLCRRHHRQGMTRSVAHASQSEPLPFERQDR